MKKLTITTLSVAFVLAAACASEEAGDDDGASGNNASGTGSGTAGSTGGKAGGGAGTSSTGGSGAGVTASGGSANPGTGGTSVAGNTSGAGTSSGTPGGAGGGVTAGTGGETAGTGPGAGGSSAGTDPGGGTGGSDGGTGGTDVTPPAVDAVVTSAQGAYWKVETFTDSTANAEVTVNDTMAQQTWEGFGMAFNEAGWVNIQKLNETDRAAALNLLFGNDGARFAWGRIPMGASDYATDRYTLDETPSDVSDFSISRDKMRLIPYIKAAQAIKPGLRFWASPWTPPTWMKNGPFQSGNAVSPFDGGSMKDDNAILTQLAQYFVKFVQAYDGEGINVEVVAPQNEPNFGQNYPSCLWASSLFTKFVGQFLGPEIERAGLDTKIMLGTMSNSDADPAIVTNVMGNATAKSYIKLLGYQWGMSGQLSGGRSHNLPIWQTEHKCGNYPWMGGYQQVAPNNKAYADESWGLIKEWIRGGVTSYSTWNAVLDNIGTGNDTTRHWAQNALLTVNGTALTVTPTYYVFRHLSQFVDPGAKVVSSSGGDTLAFKNPDNSVVAVMYNSGGAKMTTVSLAGRKVQFQMPGSGWATVKLVPAN